MITAALARRQEQLSKKQLPHWKAEQEDLLSVQAWLPSQQHFTAVTG